MRSVKSTGNKSTEKKLADFFIEHHITGWRRNYPVLGKPDFVFLKQKIAVFTDGCFWHGHNCRNVNPSQNREYWKIKQGKNKKRDKLVNNIFKKRGWKVIRIWECQIMSENLEKLFADFS